MFETLQSLSALAGIVLAAWGIGRPLARWLPIPRQDRLAVVVWSLALGMVAAGVALTAWGLVGGLNVLTIRWLTVLAAGAGCAQLGWSRRIQHPGCSEAAGVLSGFRVLRGMLYGLVFFAIGGSLASALAPAVAGDALCYHLELPKQFLSRGRIEFLPLHENSTFPLLAEMWFLWALALDSAVAAQLVHWALGLLFAAATTLLARPIVGRRAAWLAGIVALTVPGVTNQMTAPLNDLALATFTTLALVAWLEALQSSHLAPRDEFPARREMAKSGGETALSLRNSREERHAAVPPLTPALSPRGRGGYAHPWFLAAGVAAGAALSIKYVALLFAAAVALPWCWTFWRHAARRSLLLRGACIVSATALLIGGAWYARAAYYRGNPVYPFFASLAGSQDRPTVRESKTPLKWNAWDTLTAPWQVTMQPERFGGRGHQLGGLFLMVLPVAFILRRRALRWLLGVAAVYMLLWYALRQNVRFLLPLVPILAVAAAAALLELRRWPRPARLLAAVSCAAVIVLGAIIPIHRARQHVRVAAGLESREQFLLRHEPTYRAARFVNAELPPRAHILSQEHRAFYFERAFTRENAFRRATDYASSLSEASDLVPALRAAGFTHVLLAEADDTSSPYNRTLSRLTAAADAATEGRLKTCLNYEFRGADGARRRYRLIELRGQSEPTEMARGKGRSAPSTRRQ
jgi:hypothetical protein